MRYLVADIQALDDLRSQRAVKLNLQARKEERENRRLEQLARENQRRVARGLEPVESLDEIDEEEQPDVLLDQAAEIITDLIGLADADISMLTQAHGS